jgi:hypothetical protein
VGGRGRPDPPSLCHPSPARPENPSKTTPTLTHALLNLCQRCSGHGFPWLGNLILRVGRTRSAGCASSARLARYDCPLTRVAAVLSGPGEHTTCCFALQAVCLKLDSFAVAFQQP